MPFLKERYFEGVSEREIFFLQKEYFEKYGGKVPSAEVLGVQLDEKESLPEEVYQNARKILSEIEVPPGDDYDWRVDSTEKWCQDRAVYNAVLDSVDVLEGRDKNLDRGSIPKLLSDALGVSFDRHIGHDFFEDWEKRWEYYHDTETKISTGITILDDVLGGGFGPKALYVFPAGTGVGKTLTMCSMASYQLLQGKNVLYITMEMSEERIMERIDANVLDYPIDQVRDLSKKQFETMLEKRRAGCRGKIVARDYPTASAHAGHFRYLLNELQMKKQFVPDVVYVDYINICSSARLKGNANVGMYQYVKAIAEELRGLAVEFNLPIVTATQLNREGFSSADPGLEHTSESFGLPATADFMCMLVVTEELYKMDQILFIQRKNRYDDMGRKPKFVVGVDRPKFRLYDLQDSAQPGEDTGPVMDTTKFGEEEHERAIPSRGKRSRQLRGLKT